MVGSLLSLLEAFRERLEQKAFLSALTHGWERRVQVMALDSGTSYFLTFCQGRVDVTQGAADMAADLLVSGAERDLRCLFAGDRLAYLYAREAVALRGTVRDQLKWDALLRLTAKSV
ncbi:SCP-2 sterol transfer family protein [Brevibacillus sp. B_LB10_24]|uniref:SCP-2 sterol transfer family protein n=1 Tax=Brevibacillus sp. B_LB10_24 TaxID=3380645 RepID=UPI0038B8BDB8